MKGDFYVDFAIATVLFIMAFSCFFYYYNSELDLRIQEEYKENANLEITHITDSLPKENVEKRIIIVEGYSNNEFVNLSGYDIDLILNEDSERVCFDTNLQGFLANISGKDMFYLYSLARDLNEYNCNVAGMINNTAIEKISSPVYENYVINIGNYSGDYCE
jgi:hypothetical protein